MAALFPIQTTFDGGEVSPSLKGRVDTEMYRKALSLCRNFRPMPHGSLLMRAGSQLRGLWAEGNAPRLFAMRRLGNANDVVVGMGDSKVRIYDTSVAYDYTNNPQGHESLTDNLITNGHFTGGSTGWTLTGQATWDAIGEVNLAHFAGESAMAVTVATVIGNTYTLRFRARYIAVEVLVYLNLYLNGVYVEHKAQASSSTGWLDLTHTWVAAGTSTVIRLEVPYSGGAAVGSVRVDDVALTYAGMPTVDSLAVSHTNQQLDDIQFAPDRSRNRAVFSHPNVQPLHLINEPAGMWEAEPVSFTAKPTSWGGTNWPGVVEWGFQSRTWWAAAPSNPNELWGSKTGSPFEFTAGVDPDDPIDVLVSTKGTLEWLMGHHVLLCGSEAGEHAISGSGGVIAPGSINVTDEGAFGSASIQAEHIGDQVAFVTADHRHVRVLNYFDQEGGWVSRALTWAADHLTTGRIREIHWARSPVPTLFVLMSDGTLAACTYDRSEKVLGWWRIDVGMSVRSCCVANTTNGSELWLSGLRGAFAVIERMPLHETSVVYQDGAMTGTIGGSGLAFANPGLEGRMVSTTVDGANAGMRQVLRVGGSGPYVTFDIADAGLPYTVGLPVAATATTLPLEGGNPAGTSQGFKVHYSDIAVRLNNSAAPLVEGTRAGPGRPFSTPLDTVESLVTDDLKVKNVHVDTGGQITIEQDLPFRTEVCAVYAQAHISKV